MVSIFSKSWHPDSNVGWPNIGQMLVLPSWCWANVSPTYIAVWVLNVSSPVRDRFVYAPSHWLIGWAHTQDKPCQCIYFRHFFSVGLSCLMWPWCACIVLGSRLIIADGKLLYRGKISMSRNTHYCVATILSKCIYQWAAVFANGIWPTSNCHFRMRND